MSQENRDYAKWNAAPGCGSSQYFTGSVRIEPLFDAKGPARASGASVTFDHRGAQKAEIRGSATR
jgi:hypothetical protein